MHVFIFCSFRQSPLKVKALSMVCEFTGSPNQALGASFSSTKRHANTDYNILKDNYWATKKELDGKKVLLFHLLYCLDINSIIFQGLNPSLFSM